MIPISFLIELIYVNLTEVLFTTNGDGLCAIAMASIANTESIASHRAFDGRKFDAR